MAVYINKMVMYTLNRKKTANSPYKFISVQCDQNPIAFAKKMLNLKIELFKFYQKMLTYAISYYPVEKSYVNIVWKFK